MKQTGLDQDYVKMFTIIMLDICDMTEKDRLVFFLNCLSRDTAMECQRKRVQNLANAIIAAERLSDYNIRFPTNMKSQSSASHSSSGSGDKSSRSIKFKSGERSNELAP